VTSNMRPMNGSPAEINFPSSMKPRYWTKVQYISKFAFCY
jgi:hypothetical protein